MENLELVVLALALLLSTINIIVYSWFESRERYLNIGIWVMRVSGVLPGLVVLIWAIYVMATDSESTLGKALLTAGFLLVTGVVQLLSLLMTKQGVSSEKPSS